MFIELSDNIVKAQAKRFYHTYVAESLNKECCEADLLPGLGRDMPRHYDRAVSVIESVTPRSSV